MKSFQRRVIKSIKWTSVKNIVSIISGISLLIIKARVLSKEEFAYLSIIMIFLGLFKTIESFGITHAIIQRNSVKDDEASSLLFFNTFIAAACGLLLYFLSSFISTIFDMYQIKSMLEMASFIVLIGGPTSFFRAYLSKNLLFRELSSMEIIREVSLFISVVLFLVFGFGVMGIVYGNIISSFLFVILLVFYCTKNHIVKIRLYFSISKLRSYLRFGVFVMSRQIIVYLSSKLDEIVVGYFLTPHDLGVYYFGKNILEKIRMVIKSSFSNIMFPMFSMVKNDIKRTAFIYNKITKYLSFIIMPSLACVAVTAHLFVPMIFGEEWMESVTIIQIFSIILIARVLIEDISTSFLYSYNKPDIVFYIEFIGNLLYFGGLYYFAPIGILAISLVYSTYIILKIITLQFYVNRKLMQRHKDYVSYFFPTLIITLCTTCAILLFQILSQGHQYTLSFGGSILVGVGVYFIFSLFFQYNTMKELKSALIKGAI